MKKLLLMIAVFLWSGLQIAMAQGRPVKGQVLDASGEGVPGASVQVKGSTIGTITDVDGNFSLEVPDDKEILIINAIGYGVQEVKAGDGDNLVSIKLSSSSTQLNETIVTGNAIKREKRSLGYSSTTVGSDELGKGGSVSPINSLAGKVAGVNVTSTSNSPGSSSRIVLRGGSSILGNNQALIVVDGVPISNGNFGTGGGIGNLTNQVDFGNRGNDINPDDIESITVLKGPAATVIYGSAASNGALMITTKSGRRKPGGAKKTEVEVNTGVSFSSILKYPDFQNTYGQGNTHDIVDDRRENFSWGLPFDNQLRPWGQIIDGHQKVKPYSALPNNNKDFFDIGKIYTNSVAVNSGNEDMAFRLGFNTLNSNSIFPGKNYDKYNVTFNGNANLTNKFYTSISLNYNKSVADLVAGGQGAASLLDNLYQMPRDIPIRDLRDMNDRFNSMDYIDENGEHRYGYYGAYAMNPYYTLEKFKNENRVDRILGSFTIGYKPFTWLRVENRLGTDMYTDRRYQSNPLFSSQSADEGSGRPQDPYSSLQSNVGRYAEDIYNLSNIYNDLMVTFNKDIAKDINLNVLLGNNMTQQRLNNIFSSTNEDGGLIVPDYYNLQNSNGKVLSVNTLTMVRRVGLYGNADIGYKNMLFAGVTARNDWSSTVSKSYFYYGGNASFVFTELFNESLKRIWNYGKLRVSYGAVGNDAPAYSATTVYGSTTATGDFGSNVYPFKEVPGFTYGNQVGNPNITPEFSNEFEIGTEQAFFDNRITLDFSYYNKHSRDQIIPVSLPASSGFGSAIINAGLLTNSGIELAAKFTPVLTRSGFRWDVFGTFTKNTSLVKEIYPGTDQINTGNGINGMTVVAAVGKPYGTFYTNGYLRDPNGNVVVSATTGLPIIDPVGSMFFGSYQPKFQASWGTTLSYKGLSLYVMFDTKQGGQFFSRTRDLLAFVGTSKETEQRDPYVWPGSVIKNADGSYSANTKTFDPYRFYTSQTGRPNEFLLVDASYVKLREARLSYSLPSKWMSQTPFGGATVSIFGNNLLIWTPKENQFSDPELSSNGAANAQGFEFSAAPSLRNYGFSLKFTF